LFDGVAKSPPDGVTPYFHHEGHEEHEEHEEKLIPTSNYSPLLMLSQESKKREWLSKKRQMQGAQLARNEAYSGTPQ
jgi:hypothetical protein